MNPSLRPWIVPAFLGVLLLGGIAYGVRAQSAVVDVQQAYFLAPQPAGADLNVTASLFVTNHGFTRSDKLSVTAFVVPTQSGLASMTARLDVGSVAGRTTREVDLPLTIPQFNSSRSYRVDFLVFEDGLLTQRGQGTIGWGGYYAYDAAMGQSMVSEGVQASAPSFNKV